MSKAEISNFIKNNINKIKDLGVKLGIVAIVVFIATILLSSSKNQEEAIEDKKNVYKPTDTVIKGTDITEEQYEEDSNLIDKFLDNCNSGDVQAAYDLLSDGCKEELYPTIETFKEYYYNIIFDKKREFNLQAWISTSKYTVYKIRYTNSMLSTGTYNENDVYQDYITLNKKLDTEKISIGNFIDSEECNIITKTNEIEAKVIKKKIYVEEEEYQIQIKNNTEKTILLDSLENGQTIRLIGNEIEYNAYINKLFISNLKIDSGETKIINIRFKKKFSSSNPSKKIRFSKVIKDYELYEQKKETYDEVIDITINVEE